jgi:hypothetical protein
MSARTRRAAVAAGAGLLLAAASAGCARTGSHAANQVGGADNRCNAQGQNITIVCGGAGGSGAEHNPAAASQASSSSPTPQPDKVRWTGPITLAHAGGGIVLDTLPPHYDYWEANPDVEYGGTGSGSLMGSVALWTAPARPTAKQCSDWVATMNAGFFAVHVGDRVCATSPDGRPALLIVKSLPTEDYGPIVFDLTVWEAPA